MLQLKLFVQDHTRALLVVLGTLLIAAAAVVTVLIITNNNTAAENAPGPIHQLITDPAKVTTATPIPTTTPGETPTVIASPPSTPQATVAEKPKAGNTNLSTIGTKYTVEQLALASSAANLGYAQACTYTKGETKAEHKARLLTFFTASSPKLDAYNKNIVTAACTSLNNTATGIYPNGNLNVQLIEHVTGTKTNGDKIDTSYRVNAEMAYTKAENSWRIVNYAQTEEKK